VLTESWRVCYNTERPHSSLGYRPPAPAAWQTEASRGMEKWKPKNASHFPTPPATATGRYLPLPLRYTNNLAGTNYRAGQSKFIDSAREDGNRSSVTPAAIRRHLPGPTGSSRHRMVITFLPGLRSGYPGGGERPVANSPLCTLSFPLFRRKRA
jgi:hypothetical protein